MDEDPRTAGPQVGGSVQAGASNGAGGTRSPEEIRADIEQTRAEVGDTVEALAEKTDVKARAHRRVDEIKGNVRAEADELKTRAQAGTPASAQQGGRQVVATVRANPAPAVLGGAVLIAFLLGRRSGRP